MANKWEVYKMTGGETKIHSYEGDELSYDFQENTSDNDVEYKITVTDDNGCESSKTIIIPSGECGKVCESAFTISVTDGGCYSITSINGYDIYVKSVATVQITATTCDGSRAPISITTDNSLWTQDGNIEELSGNVYKIRYKYEGKYLKSGVSTLAIAPPGTETDVEPTTVISVSSTEFSNKIAESIHCFDYLYLCVTATPIVTNQQTIGYNTQLNVYGCDSVSYRYYPDFTVNYNYTINGNLANGAPITPINGSGSFNKKDDVITFNGGQRIATAYFNITNIDCGPKFRNGLYCMYTNTPF